MIEGTEKDLPVAGDKLFSSTREVGWVSSSTFSPLLQKPIALGFPLRDFTKPDTELTIDIQDHRVPARASLSCHSLLDRLERECWSSLYSLQPTNIFYLSRLTPNPSRLLRFLSGCTPACQMAKTGDCSLNEFLGTFLTSQKGRLNSYSRCAEDKNESEILTCY